MLATSFDRCPLNQPPWVSAQARHKDHTTPTEVTVTAMGRLAGLWMSLHDDSQIDAVLI
jgi:hypothetical protein